MLLDRTALDLGPVDTWLKWHSAAGTMKLLKRSLIVLVTDFNIFNKCLFSVFVPFSDVVFSSVFFQLCPCYCLIPEYKQPKHSLFSNGRAYSQIIYHYNQWQVFNVKHRLAFLQLPYICCLHAPLFLTDCLFWSTLPKPRLIYFFVKLLFNQRLLQHIK